MKELPASCLSHIHGCPKSHNLKSVWLRLADGRCQTEHHWDSSVYNMSQPSVYSRECGTHLRWLRHCFFKKYLYCIENGRIVTCLQETLLHWLLTFKTMLKTQSVLLGNKDCLCASRIQSSLKVPLR